MNYVDLTDLLPRVAWECLGMNLGVAAGLYRAYCQGAESARLPPGYHYVPDPNPGLCHKHKTPYVEYHAMGEACSYCPTCDQEGLAALRKVKS